MAQIAMMWSPSMRQAAMVDASNPVGVAVEGETDIGLALDDSRCSRRMVEPQ
jgi:hypothetical protein